MKTLIYEIEEIRGKKVTGNKIQYMVKWVGYNKTTWEPYENLIGISFDFKEFDNYLL